ncbi:MAG TPA: dihydrofolate reductase family protein [Flavipsychrobacter sp.]|nr:dihydrofolate reductase family protein [Flavipsychrobacter sp.]
MGKLIISEHISIDGFVGGPKGEMDWIGFNDELFDFVGAFTQTANTALYGRKTFEMMDAYWPTAAKEENATKHAREHSAWYNRVNKLVLSNTMVGKDRDKLRFINEGMLQEVSDAKQKGNVMLFGSPSTVHTLFAHNLVDEIYLFVNPVLLGNGIPLFKGINEQQNWKPEGNRFFERCNVLCVHYSKP